MEPRVTKLSEFYSYTFDTEPELLSLHAELRKINSAAELSNPNAPFIRIAKTPHYHEFVHELGFFQNHNAAAKALTKHLNDLHSAYRDSFIIVDATVVGLEFKSNDVKFSWSDEQANLGVVILRRLDIPKSVHDSQIPKLELCAENLPKGKLLYGEAGHSKEKSVLEGVMFGKFRDAAHENKKFVFSTFEVVPATSVGACMYFDGVPQTYSMRYMMQNNSLVVIYDDPAAKENLSGSRITNEYFRSYDSGLGHRAITNVEKVKKAVKEYEIKPHISNAYLRAFDSAKALHSLLVKQEGIVDEKAAELAIEYAKESGRIKTVRDFCKSYDEVVAKLAKQGPAVVFCEDVEINKLLKPKTRKVSLAAMSLKL